MYVIILISCHNKINLRLALSLEIEDSPSRFHHPVFLQSAKSNKNIQLKNYISMLPNSWTAEFENIHIVSLYRYASGKFA